MKNLKSHIISLGGEATLSYICRFKVLWVTKAKLLCSLHHPDDRGSKILWNVSQYLPDYLAKLSKRQHLQIGSYLHADWSTCTAGHNRCTVLYTIHPNSSYAVICSPGHSTQNRFTTNHRSQFLKFKTDFTLHTCRGQMFYQVSITTEICLLLQHLLQLSSHLNHCYKNSKNKNVNMIWNT